MRDVVRLASIGVDDMQVVGGKAARLGTLIAGGLPVPDGFCVTTVAYERVAAVATKPLRDQLGDGRREDGTDTLELLAQEIRRAVEDITLPDVLVEEIQQHWEAVAAPDGVAVRSSATAEDTRMASFAGQYHTALNVMSFDVVLDAVRHCWASLWTSHAIRYRNRQRVAHAELRMAVVVQAMVSPQWAGVMFTNAQGADGGSQAGSLLIEAVEGLGAELVDGMITPDRIEVERAGPRSVHRLSHSQTGAGGALLNDRQIRELAELGFEAEALFGEAQDVEWTFSNGTFNLVQTRPITAGARTQSAETAGEWVSPIKGACWARMSICDSWLPEPLSPLFATTLFPKLVEEWTSNWAGSTTSRANNPLLPNPMHGTVNGYAYLRFDFPLNRYPLRALLLIVRWFAFHLSPVERRWREQILPHHRTVMGELARANLGAMSTAEVLKTIDTLQFLSGRYWAIIGGLAWYWNVGEWVLSKVYPFSADSAGTVPYTSLLQGDLTLSVEGECDLADLARLEGDAFKMRLRAHLERFGHVVYHLDLVEPTPAENTDALQTAIDAYRTGRASDPRRAQKALNERREESLQLAMRALRRSPVRRCILSRVLGWTRHWGRVRDEALHYFTLGWPAMRRAYLELGRRLVEEDILHDDNDIFFLTKAEVDGWANGSPPSPTAGWAEVARHRREERQAQRLLTPPEQVPINGRIFLGRCDITGLALFGRLGGDDRDGDLIGSGVSPGRITGRARVLDSIEEADNLLPGEVLVLPHLTPAWSSLLSIAGGVITDVGGSLSHGSIVAREFGVPTVMGTRKGTKIIRDGQLVTVDGSRGRVYLRHARQPSS